MKKWDYRIVKLPNKKLEGVYNYCLMEVFYSVDGEIESIYGMHDIFEPTMKHIVREIKVITKSLTKPVIDGEKCEKKIKT